MKITRHGHFKHKGEVTLVDTAIGEYRPSWSDVKQTLTIEVLEQQDTSGNTYDYSLDFHPIEISRWFAEVLMANLSTNVKFSIATAFLDHALLHDDIVGSLSKYYKGHFGT